MEVIQALSIPNMHHATPQALQPLLAVVADGGAAAAEVREAARLLGTILAKRPAIADFLVGEGALPSVANLVATGALRKDSVL